MVAVGGQTCTPPEGEPYAAVRESHLSVVVLLGGLAFKVKKPLRLPFVDLGTRDARERVCRAELALNRRLAPDVYLGLAGIDAPDLPGLAGEPVLVMRRMPAARRLAALVPVAPAADLEAVVDDVARQVARLHGGARPERDVDLAVATRRLWAAGDEQLTEYRDVVLPGATLDRVRGLWREYLAGREGLLRHREDRGLVRDGHGDLLADDIFATDDGVRILDCLEFDRALRVNDVLADVAFLAMDLERLVAPALARRLVEKYREYSGEHHPRSLEDHYVAYRASVRAKIECLRARQGDPDAAARARLLLDLTLRRLEAGRVHLVLVGGLPGSGKSTLAEAVARDGRDGREGREGREGRDWIVLSSDVVRRDLVGGVRSAGRAALDRGAYDRAHTEATYAEVLRRAELALRAGESVVLDASWTDPRARARAADLARACSVPLTAVRCVAPLAVCERRLVERVDTHASDADVAVLRAMAARAASWPEAVGVDTTRPVAEAVGVVDGELRRRQVCST